LFPADLSRKQLLLFYLPFEELEVGSFVQAPPMSGNGAWVNRSGDFQKYGTRPGSYGF
jgi:hypothetical protein